MGEQSESFSFDVEEMFAKRVYSFSEWVAKDWAFEGDDDLGMTEEERKGWNKCCESISGAASVWLDDNKF